MMVNRRVVATPRVGKTYDVRGVPMMHGIHFKKRFLDSFVGHNNRGD